jgi:hypothetical protein
MSNADLDLLEREVVAARGRLAGNMARLRDPAALSSFKSEVTIQANSIKDEWAQKVSDVATNAARTIWSDFKDRAIANPGAAFAIGAGLAWHFTRHPPITTLLVGLGLSSLVRTDPSSGPSPIITSAAEFAGTVSDKVYEWSEDAYDAVATAREKTGRWAQQTHYPKGELLSQASTTVVRIGGETATHIERAFSDQETRDHYLLGVATLAVGAAAVIAIQRKDG